MLSRSKQWVRPVRALSHKISRVSSSIIYQSLLHKQTTNNTQMAMPQTYMDFSHSINLSDDYENSISSARQNNYQMPASAIMHESSNRKNNNDNNNSSNQPKASSKRPLSLYMAGALLLVSSTYCTLGYITMDRYDVIEPSNETIRGFFIKYFPLSESFLDFLEEKYYHDHQMSFYQKQGFRGLNTSSHANINGSANFMSTINSNQKSSLDYIYSYDEHETQGQKLYMKQEEEAQKRQAQQQGSSSASDALLHGRFFSMATGEVNAQQKTYLPLILLPDDTNPEVNKLTMHMNDLITNFINNASIAPESTDLPEHSKRVVAKIANDLEALTMQARGMANFSKIFEQASAEFRTLTNGGNSSAFDDNMGAMRTKQDIINQILLVENRLVEYVNTKR